MSKRSGPPTGDYEIGYGRPPKAHQFQRGKSGNPGGRRKKGNQCLRSAVLAELAEPLTYMTKDGPRKAPAVDLIARQLVTGAAARGDRHNVKSLIDILGKKQDHFVGPGDSIEAETEQAASVFDTKFGNAVAALRREADERLAAESNLTKTEEDGAGEG